MVTNQPSSTSPNKPSVERHHWQALAVLVSFERPQWPASEIVEVLWRCRDMQPFAELAALAIRTAQDPRWKTPASIQFAAAGTTASEQLAA